MRGFPQPSSNPGHVRPRLFAACFCALGRSGSSIRGMDEARPQWEGGAMRADPDEHPGVVCCVFGWDPAAARRARAWPEWGGAIQMCDWRGGSVEGGGLDDFVVFGEGTRRWLVESGMEPDAGLAEAARWMALASMDFFAQRHGAPLGAWSSMAWIAHGPLARQVLEHASLAKSLIVAQWEAEQLSRACGSLGGEAQQLRL